MKTSLFFLIAALPVITTAQQPGTDTRKKIDALVAEAEKKQVFSGNILIAKDNAVIYEKSSGKADIPNNIANTPATSFQIGSISKLFTRILIQQLAAGHKLGLDDTLGKYIPGFPPEIAGKVTIRQLTDHTSGLGDYTQQDGFLQKHQDIQRVSDILPLIRRDKLLFAPGTGKQYSNSGYVLLSAVIEKVTGLNYGTVLKEKILDPLGMDDTGFNAYTKDIAGKAKGYLSNQPGVMEDNLNLHIVGAGDGGIYSTARDMWKFMQSYLNDNRLLSEEDKLHTVNTPLFPVTYQSWAEFRQKGRMMLAGGAPGISALAGFDMEKKLVIIVLSNFDERTAESMGQRISAVLYGREPKPFQLAPSRFIYTLLKEKGPQYFLENYRKEMEGASVPADDDMVLLYAGQQLLKDKDADAAIALYTVYTKEFPNIVVAWNDLGDAFLMKGDKQQAKSSYSQALKLRPANQRAIQALQKLQ